MHARPKFFAKVMGELLFWVGEDKMTFGSDYAIWEPKWQVEGFVDWEMPDDEDVRRLPAPGRRGQEEDPRPQRREAVRRRGAGGAPGGRRAGRPRRQRRGGRGVTLRAQVFESSGHGLRPGARRADHHARLRRLLRRDRGRRRLGAPAAAHAAVRAELRVPDGGRRARRGARVAGGAGRSAIDARGPLHGRGDQRRRQRRGRLRGGVPGRDGGELEALRALFQRKALVARAEPAARRITGGDARRADRARRGALPRAAPGARDRRVATTRRRS